MVSVAQHLYSMHCSIMTAHCPHNLMDTADWLATLYDINHRLGHYYPLDSITGYPLDSITG